MSLRSLLAAAVVACTTALLGCAGHESRIETALAALGRLAIHRSH